MKDQITRIKTDHSLRIQKPQLLKEDFELFDFQHRAVLMAYMVSRMIIGYDTGLGKSAISITLMALLREKKNFDGVMYVVVPRSALYQWKEEVKKFSHMTAHVIDAQAKGMKNQKQRSDYYKNHWGEHDIVISTYSLLYKDLLYIEPHLHNTVAVLDEVVAFKNRKSKLYTTAGRVLSEKCPRIYGLSATILQNDLTEPYNIFQLFIPGSMPSYRKFESTYCIMENIYLGSRRIKKIKDFTNIDGFYDLIDPFYIGCRKTDVKHANLPKVVIKPVYTWMAGKQLSAYKQVLSDFLVTADGEEEEITSVLKKMIRCQQISDSPAILDLPGDSAKEKELLRIIREDLDEKEKVVIFTRFKTGVYRLEEVLKEYNPLSITGDRGGQEREDIKNMFTNDPDRRIMIINTAAKEAVNLQVSGNLIFYNLDWSYGNILQIIGRINRLGSDHEFNNIYVLINKDSIDEYVYQSVVRKEGYFNKLLGSVGYTMSPQNMRKFADSFKQYSKRLKARQ